jgi:hypothetical protein
MNLQSLVVVLLRLVSLNFLLQTFYQLIPSLTRFFAVYRNLAPDESRSLLILPITLMVGFAVGAVLLWLFAIPIARLITRGLAPEVSLGTLTLMECYSLLFIGIGLFYAVAHFAPVLNWTHYILRLSTSHQLTNWREDVKWYDVSDAIVPFIVGLILFVSGRKWALALVRKEAANTAVSETATSERPTRN